MYQYRNIWFVVLLMLGVAITLAHNEDPPPPPQTPRTSVPFDEVPVYSQDIAPIFAQNCVGCHIENEFGYEYLPMETAGQVQEVAEDINFVIQIDYMPPWPPAGDSPAYHYERTLTDAQIAAIDAWVMAGAPLDVSPDTVLEPTNATLLPTIEEDLILTMEAPYTPTTERTDDYRCFILDPEFEEDTYITGYEVVPGNTAIVHHTILFLGRPEQRAEAEARSNADDQPGWTCYGGPGLRGSVGDNSTARAVLNRVESLTGADVAAQLLELIRLAGGQQAFVALLNAPDADAQLDALLGELPNNDVLRAQLERIGNAQNLARVLGQLSTRARANLTGSMGIGNNIGGWTPGNAPTDFPDGTGMLVPADHFIIMQMHYNTLGGDGPDQSSVALETSTDPRIQALRTQPIVGPVEIPCPADVSGPQCDRDTVMETENNPRSDSLLAICSQTLADYADNTAEAARTSCDFGISESGWALATMGHMHELGASIHVEHNPDSPDAYTLLDIPDWDFDWQGEYWFKEPIWLEAGDTVRITCTWDNRVTRFNPEPRYVVWGEGTRDEMCLNYLTILPAEAGTPAP